LRLDFLTFKITLFSLTLLFYQLVAKKAILIANYAKNAQNSFQEHDSLIA
jgi:hypothetical protein